MPDFFKKLQKTWNEIADPEKLSKDVSLAPLMSAIKNNNHSYIKKLVERGAKLNQYGFSGHTPFHEAIRLGNVSAAKFLITLGANPKLPLKTPYIYKNPIHLAIISNQPKMVPVLKAIGFSLNETEANGWTPLDHAIAENKVKMVEALLESGANPRLKNLEGRTAGLNAISTGKTDVVRVLLRFPRAHVTFSKSFYRKEGHIDPPLLTAINRGYTEIAKEMIETGVDLFERGHEGWSSLHHATRRGDLGLMKLLLQKSSDLVQSEANDNEMTPLDLLCSLHDTLDVTFLKRGFDMLVDYGARTNASHRSAYTEILSKMKDAENNQKTASQSPRAKKKKFGR